MPSGNEATPRVVRAALYVLAAARAIQAAHAFLGIAHGELITQVIEDWLYNRTLLKAPLYLF
jgi:hypothetical protein